MASSTDAPVDLYIAAYGDPDAARGDWEAIKQLADDDRIKVDGLVLVSRRDDGKIHVDDDFHDAAKGAGWGAVGGAVIGAIFPPAFLASAAVGAGVGAIAGGLKSHHEKAEIKEDVEDTLPLNSSGIVAMFEEQWAESIDKALSKASNVTKEEVDGDSANEVKAAASTTQPAATRLRSGPPAKRQGRVTPQSVGSDDDRGTATARATRARAAGTNRVADGNGKSGAARKRKPRATVSHLSVAERVARGKAARNEVPRSGHAAFEPLSTRADPVELLERQARTRVPELVPIRYGRMLVSPFTFYRGAAMIMAHDLAPTPRSGLTVQCCGDAHLSNFGVFASPERRLVFDLNDFDETLPGPWEWDVKRLAASMLIAARDNGFRARDQERIVLDTVGKYRTAMASFAGMTSLGVWYAHLDTENALNEYGSQFKPKKVKQTEKALAKARTKDSMAAFAKLTQVVDGQPRIIDQPPLIVPIEQLSPGEDRDKLFERLRELLRGYPETLDVDRRVLFEQFELIDFAGKVVGVGSVGTRAWIALLLGRDGQDPLFLQIKQAEASVLEELLGPSEFSNHGQRVVVGQRLMQASSDIFLGWLHVPAGSGGQAADYYGRQLKDWKGSAEIEQMTPKAMATYGTLCGWTLARAHARSGDRVAIAAYLGNGDSFDRALVEFSRAYAEQNERDYQALADAVDSGRIDAQTGL